MTTVANASVVFKDKNGNVGTVKGASANDVTKIRTAISDVAQVVDPTSHLPINATTSSVGVVQLADSAAVAAGTSGRVVDAAQLKDAIEHVTPAGNVMTTDTAQTVTAVKTFSSLPESSVAPTTNNQLVNKKYVDDHVPSISNMVTTDTAQTISAVKTFTALPQSSVAPSASSDLVNKAYVDGQVAVDSTYTEPSVSKGILSPATNLITPPSAGQTFEARGVKTGTVHLHAGTAVPEGYLLCNGAAVSRTDYAGLFAIIGTVFGSGDGSTTFNLPDFRNRYPIGAGDNALGTYIAEQLPNIHGEFVYSTNNQEGIGIAQAIGSFSTGQSIALYDIAVTPGYHTAPQQMYFDALNSNSIYANNGKVYPASLALNFIIKT